MTSEPAVWTVLRLLNWTKDYFGKAGIEDPRLSAEILLAHVLACKRIELYTRFDYQPTPAELDQYRSLVQRARQFEPIAYLVGRKEFYSLALKITPDVLVPRPETELLVGEALGHLRGLGRAGLAWDVCTGSGCVAVATAVNWADATVLATDISPAAVAVATENAAALGVAARVRCRTADLLTLPEDCRDLKDFDVITANPPYVSANQGISETVKREPPAAVWGGKDGLDFIRPLIAAAPAVLRPGGLLALEFGFGQADAVRDLIVAGGKFDEPRILRDHQGIERAAAAVRRAS
ncbi:MAG: peptide chain release factor N(5)-glutamine methyltransferase [Phycisphaerae bacterium]